MRIFSVRVRRYYKLVLAEDGQDGQNKNMAALTVLPAFKNESGAV